MGLTAVTARHSGQIIQEPRSNTFLTSLETSLAAGLRLRGAFTLTAQWYYSSHAGRHGPVTLDELKRLAASGTLQPTDLVWWEGADEWQEAGTIEALFPPRASDTGRDGRRRRHPVDPSGSRDEFTSEEIDGDIDVAEQHPLNLLLPYSRRAVSEDTVRWVSGGIVTVGWYAQWIDLFVFLAFYVLLGLKVDSIRLIVEGAGLSLVLLLLQFWAQRISNAFETTVASTPVRLASSAIVDGLAVSCIIAAIVLPPWFLLEEFQAGDGFLTLASAIIAASLMFVSISYVGALAVHPALLNVETIPSASAGEEAVGVITLLLRMVFKCIPIVYAAGMSLISIFLMVGVVTLLTKGAYEALEIWSSVQPLLFGCAGLPLAGYLVYLAYSLIIDLWRATLIMPSQVRELGRIIESRKDVE